MTKRLIEIDDELLAEAQKAAQTSTIRATVELALKRLVDRERAIEHIQRLRKPGSLDPAMVSKAREPRVGAIADVGD